MDAFIHCNYLDRITMFAEEFYGYLQVLETWHNLDFAQSQGSLKMRKMCGVVNVHAANIGLQWMITRTS